MKKFDAQKDYYGVLGVGAGARKDEIDKAYRAQARTLHPDSGGSEEGMKSLNEAHEVLSHPETRRAYDAARNIPSTAVSSAAFDPAAASASGPLKITVEDGDFVGLCMGAATCFGVGAPLLLLVEAQWVFFLWPLRIIALAALGLGVGLGRLALKAWQRREKARRPRSSRIGFALQELLYWLVIATVSGMVLFLAYGI